MKAENRITVIGKCPVATGTHNHRPADAEAKPVVVRAWAPQPDPLTREETRRIVIDLIG
jgi:hypothetical protein